jgi:hypothetical protein
MPGSLKIFLRSACISTLLFLTVNSCFAQEESKPGFFDRVYFGGGLGLQFGDQTVIQVAPIIGYKVTEKFHVGVGGTYIYYHVKDPYYNLEYKTNIYGGSVFTKYFLFDEIFAYAEYGILNLEVPYDPLGSNYYLYKRKNVSSLLLGGGYRQMIGESVGIELVVLYDVIDDRDSPYSNPVIRLGIVAGF